jgi:serine/threonine protein kinase/class 3 adenylate cyclase
LEDESPYLIVEWLGETILASAFRNRVPLDIPDALMLVQPLAAVLADAHRLGLAHGRLCPGQLRCVGGTEPKADFTGVDVQPDRDRGASRSVDASCRAPEVEGGRPPGRAADVYSLGALLLWLITGEPARPTAEPEGSDPHLANPVARLARAMMAGDQDERPLAREVHGRMAEMLERSTRGPSRPAPCPPTGAVEVASQAVGASPLPAEVPTALRRERIGRFRLLQKLGSGGMGEVYRAEDTADGTVVAIKFIRPECARHPEALRRFRKEARLLAEAHNPHIANLLEVNEDGGVHYLVLEYVEGQTLASLIGERGRLDEPTSLAIMADVARALAEAHARGIVHRDIKPGNILLTNPGAISDVAEGAVVMAPCPSGTVPRVKLLDFGLARHVVEVASLEMTAPGAIVGTPRYMAPEQCAGGPIGPPADVYAMGATLFHMLAGRPPFIAPSTRELVALHRDEPPAPLQRFNPGVSDAVCRVVEKALAKEPGGRYADAGALLLDLERLLRGEPTGLAAHPILPACDPRDVLRYDFRWELESSPRQLWPLVTDTDRLNRALGWSPIQQAVRNDPGRGVRRFAEGRKAGTVEAWEEYPYEWVEPRRMGVFRDYSRGRFEWLTSTVELIPRAGGGTTLIHRLRLVPRGRWIRTASPLGVGIFLRRSLGRVYRRIDAALAGKLGHRPWADPFEEPAELSPPLRRRLDRSADALVGRGVAPAVAERLCEFLARAPAQEVARIRPLALAHRWGLDPDQVAAACLYGAREGLLVLLWDLLCPVCRLPSDLKDSLRALRAHGRCEACNLDFVVDLAHSVEMIFRAHPEIRGADAGIYCIGGPARSPHVPAQVRVAPGERLELDLSLPEGTYRLRGPQLPWSIDFRVRAADAHRRWDIDLRRGLDPGWPRALGAGEQVLILSNDCGRELLVRVERAAPREDVLTAARAASLPLFRELFPGEVLSPGQLISIAAVTLLVTGLERPADLYVGRGEMEAAGVLLEYIRLSADVIRDAGGVLVKTVDEGVVASFSEPEAAVQAGLALQGRPAPRPMPRGLRPRVSIHRGAALVATLDDRLDYLGAVARDARQILQPARGGELILTRSVADDPRVAGLLDGHGLVGEALPTDVAGHLHVLRIRPPAG